MTARRLLPLLVLLLSGAATPAPTQPVPSSSAARFAAVDVYIDPHNKPLAAYQFELTAANTAVTLVGVEGGEHPAFASSPYYDTKANLQRRIVIAAFNAGRDLPTGRTRVARLMVRITGDAAPDYTATLQTAASSDAATLSATIDVQEGAKP